LAFVEVIVKEFLFKLKAPYSPNLFPIFASHHTLSMTLNAPIFYVSSKQINQVSEQD
jgi:hypothetical protein